MTKTPEITAEDLCAQLGGTLTGDGSTTVRSVAPLDVAGSDDLSWVGSAKYLPQLADSSAGVVLIPKDCAAPTDRTTISVDDPDLAMCSSLAALAPPAMLIPPGVDARACVDETATVSGACVGPLVYVGRHAVVEAGTQLHPGVYVGPHAHIGRDCVLHPNVVVGAHCELGDRTIIHMNSSIGADGFGYLQREGRHVKIPQIGRVIVEDDVEIGANSCVDRARSGETRVGRGTKIDNLVQIAHNVRVGKHCVLVGQVGISGSTTLGDYVVLAGQAGVADHLRVGDRVQIGAQSGVMNDITEPGNYIGAPAVPFLEHGRQLANLRRLPKLAAQLRDLVKRIERLESTADHHDGD